MNLLVVDVILSDGIQLVGGELHVPGEARIARVELELAHQQRAVQVHQPPVTFAQVDLGNVKITVGWKNIRYNVLEHYGSSLVKQKQR